MTVPAEVVALLDDRRPLAELSNAELTQRIRKARSLIGAGGLDAETTRKLQALIKAARAERTARQQRAEQQPAAPAEAETAQPAAPADAESAQPAAPADAESAQPAETQPPVATEIPEDVMAFINDERPLAGVSRNELRARLRQARQFMKANQGKAEIRKPLNAVIVAVRAELARRNGQAAQPSQDEETVAQTQPEVNASGEPITEGDIPVDVVVFLRDRRPARDLSMNELQARIANAETHLQGQDLAPETRDRIVSQLEADRAELQRRGEAGELTERLPQPGTGEVQDETQLDNNAASPEAEAKAREFLTDPRRAEEMSDTELRARLNGIRTLLAGNLLSRETERQLRQKLAAERAILRARIAAKQNERDDNTGGQAGKPRVEIDNDYLINIEIVLADRRPSRQLADYELRRRIQVYREAAFDNRYSDADRRRWREWIAQDRRELRMRLIEARRERAEELEARRRAGGLDIDIDVILQPGRPRDVDAAEVDDEEIEDFLVAPPRRKVERRYTVEELERSPNLRDAISRIEIDTIHFGFNEAFVREEEIESLDRIAEIMERILAAHPREVFVIEGHTDAVGSDAYNLRLSRQRAQAVKQALTTYYVIPEENLRTLGYGERFLKIPTAEAEAENRRVSIGRATALFGELDE
ncbi:MAG: OmpA family protein [Hyphomicrobiales bacterium]